MSLFNFRFKFSGEGDGWANARVWSDDGNISTLEMEISDIWGDSLGYLASAVNALWQGSVSATCTWPNEPGGFRWCLTKEKKSVKVQILYFHKEFVNDDEEGIVRFEIACPLIVISTEIEKQMRQILDDIGIDGYYKEWDVPFPMETMNELQSYIREYANEN